MTSTLFPRFGGLTWADWRSFATSLDCRSCDFLSREMSIWPGSDAPLEEPEMAEVSISVFSVVSAANLSTPC